MIHLGGLQVGGDEDVCRQAEGRRRRGRGTCKVAGRGASQRLNPKIDGSGGRDGDRPVLEAQRRIARVVLDPEPVEPKRGRQTIRREQRRRADRQSAGRRRIDREQLGIPPDTGAPGRNRLSVQGLRDDAVVVLDLERPKAGGTDVRQPNRLLAPTPSTAESDDPTGRRRGGRWAGRDLDGHAGDSAAGERLGTGTDGRPP